MGNLAETLGDLLPHHPESGFEPGVTNGEAGPLGPRPAQPQLNAGRAGPAAAGPPGERTVVQRTELRDSRARSLCEACRLQRQWPARPWEGGAPCLLPAPTVPALRCCWEDGLGGPQLPHSRPARRPAPRAARGSASGAVCGGSRPPVWLLEEDREPRFPTGLLSFADGSCSPAQPRPCPGRGEPPVQPRRRQVDPGRGGRGSVPPQGRAPPRACRVGTEAPASLKFCPPLFRRVML